MPTTSHDAKELGTAIVTSFLAPREVSREPAGSKAMGPILSLSSMKKSLKSWNPPGLAN